MAEKSEGWKPYGLEPIWVVRCAALTATLASLGCVAHLAHDTETKGGCFLIAVLCMQLSGLLPLYCVALMTPVLATMLRTMPISAEFTAKKCFAAMFNPLTAVVLGSFAAQAIATTCRIEARFLQAVSARFGDRPRLFLLVLMLGCMLCSTLTMVTLLALAGITPLARKATGAGGVSLVLGVGVACTLGSVVTPISGTTSLITLSVLGEYGSTISFLDWILVALPTLTCVCIMAWGVLLLMFGPPPSLEKEDLEVMSSGAPPLTGRQICFLGLAALFLLCCVAEPVLTPWVGDAGNIGLLLTAVTFSMFLSRKDFLDLPWDILAILFGVNTLALVIKESGVGLVMVQIVSAVQVSSGVLWVEVFKLIVSAGVVGSLAPHSVVATIAVPIVVALGYQLYAPVLVALLFTIALGCALGTPYGSIDLIMTLDEVEKDDAELERAPLRPHTPIADRKDFVKGGITITMLAWLIIGTVGYSVGMMVVGVPPLKIIRHEPAALRPSGETISRLRDLEHRIEKVDPAIGTELDDLLEELDSSQATPSYEKVEKVSDDDWGKEINMTKEEQKAKEKWGWGNSYGLSPKPLRTPDGKIVSLNEPETYKGEYSLAGPKEARVHGTVSVRAGPVTHPQAKGAPDRAATGVASVRTGRLARSDAAPAVRAAVASTDGAGLSHPSLRGIEAWSSSTAEAVLRGLHIE